MMKLSQAATFFHTTPFADAYDPLVTFNGRLSPYDDNARDSLSTERRIMAVGAGVAIPARRVVKVGNQCWIVGQGSQDFHGTEELRNKYVLHRADELAQVRTFGEVLEGVGGQDLWANRLWVKNSKEGTESSEMYGSYQIYFSEVEDLRDAAWTTGAFTDGREDNVLVSIQGRWHLIRTTLRSAGGLLVAVADELPDPVILDVDYTTNVYNRALDKKVPTDIVVKAVNLRWQSNFTYLAQYSPKFQPGDIQIVVLKTAVTPSAGDNVVVRGTKYKVVTVFNQTDVWGIHLRHA
jgi:hypothetical protein